MADGMRITVVGTIISKELKNKKDGSGQFRIVGIGWMGAKLEAFATPEEFERYPAVGGRVACVFEGKIDRGNVTGLGKLLECRPEVGGATGSARAA